jgi:hypothetical protein
LRSLWLPIWEIAWKCWMNAGHMCVHFLCSLVGCAAAQMSAWAVQGPVMATL